MSDTGTAPTRILARVAELWRYPVKSMAGESLQEAELAWHGIAGDRRWAFVRGDTPRSGFPWLTIRERPEMVHYRPYLRDPARPNRSEVWVRRPDGEDFDVIDPALAVGLSPGARPIKLDRGIFDVQPVSVLSRQSLDGLAALVGTPLDARRFRANIVLEAEGSFPEDEWVGRTLELGSARIRVDQRDERCVLINVDPVSGERDPSVLNTVGRERDACLGVYGATVRPAWSVSAWSRTEARYRSFESARFLGPLPEPDVPITEHPALHKPLSMGSRSFIPGSAMAKGSLLLGSGSGWSVPHRG